MCGFYSPSRKATCRLPFPPCLTVAGGANTLRPIHGDSPVVVEKAGSATPEPPSPSARSRLLTGALVGALAGFLARDLFVDSMASFWLPAALVGGLLWLSPLRRLVAALTLGLLLLWIAVGSTTLARALARPLVREDPSSPADAVFVLASRLQTDGETTGDSTSRLLHGLELLGLGLAPRLILTEHEPADASYEDAARDLIRSLGLSVDLVALGPVESTRDEAVIVADHAARQGWGRLLVVTSPTHTLRACRALEAVGVEVICSPAVETGFDLETLDRPAERFPAFRKVVYEHLALWRYRSKDWL